MLSKSSSKAGIFSGTFDPIHLGHLKFALDAISKCGLSEIYFLPERQPRHKITTHYAHRLAMIKLAIKPYSKLKVLDLPDKKFSVSKTLPRLNLVTTDKVIYFLQGSDAIKHISRWPGYKSLLKTANFIVGLRSNDKADKVKELTKDWPSQVMILEAKEYKDITSRKIREGLMENREVIGLLPSTKKYIKDNWLYISLDKV